MAAIANTLLLLQAVAVIEDRWSTKMMVTLVCFLTLNPTFQIHGLSTAARGIDAAGAQADRRRRGVAAAAQVRLGLRGFSPPAGGATV